MRIEIRQGQSQPTARLTSAMMLRFLITEDRQMEDLIIFQKQPIALVASDRDLYVAICSVKDYDSFSLKKLRKLLETCTIFSDSQPGKKHILTEDELERIRKDALASAEGNQQNLQNQK